MEEWSNLVQFVEQITIKHCNITMELCYISIAAAILIL